MCHFVRGPALQVGSKGMSLSPRVTLASYLYCSLNNKMQITPLWCVTKILSCRVSITSRQGMRQLGVSFGSIFLPFFFKSRDFKIQRRRRWRKRHKSNRFYNQNNNFARASRSFVHFFTRFYTTTTWKYLISHFMEYVNKQRRNAISLSELGCGP